MIRFIFWGVLFFLSSSCRDAGEKLRGEELCEQMHSCINDGRKPIDSLTGLSVGLSSVERYAVLLHAIQYSIALSDNEGATRYLQQLDSLPFPEVHDKASCSLLLSCYAYGAHNLNTFAPRLIDPKPIVSLLFDMENRWQLTPQEKLHFLVRKSEIYSGVFKEYKSAVIIVRDAVRLARECGADQKLIMNLLRVLYSCLLQLDEADQLMALENDFVELAEECQFDSLAKETIYQSFGMLFEQQGNYRKAYDLLSRTERIHSGVYNPMFTRVYVGIDSIPAALTYIEKCRKNTPHQSILAGMMWNEACIRKKMGDDVGYERCLRESVELFDHFPKYEADDGAPSEAYARILWQEGRRSEAIRRMELVTRKLTTRTNYDKSGMSRIYDSSLRMNRFRLLIDYYDQAGRTADALRQSLLCDSLEQLLAKGRLQREQEKTTTTMYAMDLVRNLELRATEVQRERLKWYATCLMLGVALLGVVVLFVLYRQRKRQLNVLYARQKEIEKLQAEKQRMVLAKSEQLSPEELLFRNLEQQFYDEELFRNPGFSRDDLCRLGGTNRMYVSTCINKYAGMNINQWINKARIDYAIRLIGEGECDLIRLSEQSGFSSIKSFFRSFKQFTNLSPRQYIVRDREQKE